MWHGSQKSENYIIAEYHKALRPIVCVRKMTNAAVLEIAFFFLSLIKKTAFYRVGGPVCTMYKDETIFYTIILKSAHNK